jgi:hypothetical protein
LKISKVTDLAVPACLSDSNGNRFLVDVQPDERADLGHVIAPLFGPEVPSSTAASAFSAAATKAMPSGRRRPTAQS